MSNAAVESLLITALTAEEDAARLAALELATRLVDGMLPLSLDQVQVLYEVVLDEYADFAEGTIALGIAFGELIAEKAGLEWVRVTDEFGSETALAVRGCQVTCHPVSMVQKRIARGERIDLAQLRDDTIRTVQDLVDSGSYKAR